MRVSFVLAGLLACLALAGCSDDPPADDPLVEAGDDGRQSVGLNTPDPPHDEVVFLQSELDLVGQATQEFDVTIPDNVTVVDFFITSSATASTFSGFTVDLGLCGSYTHSGTSIGDRDMAGRLCRDSGNGVAKLIVTNTGLVQGPIKLTGHVLKGNVTAAPAS